MLFLVLKSKYTTVIWFIAGIAGRLLLSFSMYSNAKKIINTSQPAGTLTSINGIRFISMTWVILGHTFAFGANTTRNIHFSLSFLLIM